MMFFEESGHLKLSLPLVYQSQGISIGLFEPAFTRVFFPKMKSRLVGRTYFFFLDFDPCKFIFSLWPAILGVETVDEVFSLMCIHIDFLRELGELLLT